MSGRTVFQISAAAALLLLAAVNAQAGAVRQMTDTKDVSFDWAMPIGNGSEILVATSTNQYPGGGNAEHRFQISSIDPVTGMATQMTSFPASLSHVRHNLTVTDDGQWFAFISNGDLIPGQNGDRSDEAFSVKRDGTGLTQLTHISGPNAGSVTRIAMSGASSRVAFVTSANINAGNPQRAQQLFVIDRDGSNLIQLTNAPTGAIGHMWISDNGTRLAFNHTGDLTGGNADHNEEVFTIAVGDALPRQITSSTVGEADSANISGDGNTIVFESTANYTGGNTDGSSEIFSANWTTGAITQVTNQVTLRTARQPWPTNDGSVILYSSDRSVRDLFEVWRVNSNGTGATQLTGLFKNCEHPVVSGDGSRYAVWLDGGLYTGTTAGTEVPLIVRDIQENGYLDVSADGKKMTFISRNDPFGTNPDRKYQLFVINTDGTGLRQLTSATADEVVTRPAINGDGSRIYFESTFDPFGTNNDLKTEVFGINSDGTGLKQYTSCIASPGYGSFSGYIDVSDDGNTIAFVSYCNFTGQNPGGGRGPLFKMDKLGNNLTQITLPAASTSHIHARLDATGTWVSFTSWTYNTGPTDVGAWRVKTDGTNLFRITPVPNVVTLQSDISGDGSRVVFAYPGDPLGTNADHNAEVFLYDAAASPQLRQLTVTTKGNQAHARISGDGRYVYFQSDSELFENDPDHAFRTLYRHDLTTSAVQRSGGLRFENFGVAVAFLSLSELSYPPNPITSDGAAYPHAVSSDGSVVAYHTFSDSVGKNPDEYWEYMTLDYKASNPPMISGGPAPTTVTFFPEPGLVSYDVIRGDLANLHNVGSTVDLGAVDCIENDSGDTTTVNYPDLATPSPGQGFFYLFRGSMTAATGPGSYGTGKSGFERVAGSGDCTP